MKEKSFLLLFLSLAGAASASTWYVDAQAGAGGNGQSWGSAWQNVTGVDGNKVQPGDTVYISGGPSGYSRTYNLSAAWAPVEGKSGNPVKYQIGQDSQHNGTALFVPAAGQDFINGSSRNFWISGDAGDGARHFKVGDDNGVHSVYFSDSYVSGVRISYVDGGAKRSVPFSLYYYTGYCEIDHCYAKMLVNDRGSTACYVFTDVGDTLAADTVKIHDNEFHVMYYPASQNDGGHQGWGDDAFTGQWWTGITIAHNKVVMEPDPNFLAEGDDQHGDGCQPLGGSNITIDGNIFQDCVNSAVFIDAVKGGFSNLRVVNNIAVTASATVRYFQSLRGFEIIDQTGSGTSFSHVYIDNNLCDGEDNQYRYSVDTDFYPDDQNPNTRTALSDIRIFNNVGIANGGMKIQSLSGMASGNNVVLSYAQAASTFVRYSQFHGDTADFHTKAGDTLLRGKAHDESSIFTDSMDGRARPK